jgi:hypothetical protein
MAHLSFFMLIVFAFICEIVRFAKTREFFFRNITVVLLGVALGCLLHPNYPNNLLSLYLNGVLVPFYSLFHNIGIDFASEFSPSTTKSALIANLAVFSCLNVVLWMLLFCRRKISLDTLVWWGCAGIYLLLAFGGQRYWYRATPLVFIFFASYLNDWRDNHEWKAVLPKLRRFVIIYGVLLVFLFPSYFTSIKKDISRWMRFNSHYENVGKWMNRYIPSGETIYHAYWWDAPYFICFNPKNNYLVVLDPIYMAYYSPSGYIAYNELKAGRIVEPYRMLKDVFKISYGYTRKNTGLYLQVAKDTTHFNIIYEDSLGVVFVIQQL